MADASLQIGNGNWAVKPSLLLGYNVTKNGYNPVEMAVSRATTATRTNELGIIETKASDVARINYEGGVGSLLIEPQRTNLVLRSEDFENGIWQKNNVTITSNVVISPNNTLTADKLIPSATASVNKYLWQDPTTSNGVNHSITVFAKSAEYDRLKIDQGNNSKGAWFNLSNGTIGTVSSGVTAEIKNMGNNWYRCSINTVSVATNVFFLIGGSSTESLQVGDGTSGIYIWGTQLEVGAYATSYIPTVASTVTRNADVISKTGISDLIGQTEGTMFAEVNINNWETSTRVFGISDGTVNNRIIILQNSSNRIRALISILGILETDINTLTLTNGLYKIAIAYKSNDVVFYVNGILIGSDTSVSIPSCSQLYLGKTETSDSTNFLNNKINSAQLYKTRLTDAECIALTTL